MTVNDLVQQLGLKVISGKGGLNKEVSGAYVSDLLSDVMASSKALQAWITIQQHKNIMAIAQLKNLSCIILVKNLLPNEDTKQKSDEIDLPILQTDDTTFDISGKLYLLLKNIK